MFLADLALIFLARFMGQDKPKQISMVDSRSSAIFIFLSFLLKALCRKGLPGMIEFFDFSFRQEPFCVNLVSSFEYSLALTFDYV